MYKYRHFPIVFGIALILLLVFFFPISFDNNDDHYMFFISAGIFTGKPLPELMLTNVITGKFLNILFSITDKINWYMVYLVIAELFCFTVIYALFVQSVKTTIREGILAVLFLFTGFAALSFAKLQFTTVALYCVFTALLCLYSDIKIKYAAIIAAVLITIGILIRKESFYLFLFFSIPLLLKYFKSKNLYPLAVVLVYATVFFFTADYINSNRIDYREKDTYEKLRALDIIAARHISYDQDLLNQHNLSQEDIALMRMWFPCDTAYTSASTRKAIDKMHTPRSAKDIFQLIKSFAHDERYPLLMLLVSFILVAFFLPKKIPYAILNVVLLLILIGYLAIYARMPHRLIYPVLFYVSLFNFYTLFRESDSRQKNAAILLILLLPASYKFYCVMNLIPLHEKEHLVFKNTWNEVNAHPDKVFVAMYDGFPVQLMEATIPPSRLPHHYNSPEDFCTVKK